MRLLLSISIFRRLSLFQKQCNRWRGLDYTPFNLHFQETFFVSQEGEVLRFSDAPSAFQSPFSGDFLCFPRWASCFPSWLYRSFNLHFQETFFVSGIKDLVQEYGYKIFQSPFSGDFLCFIRSISLDIPFLTLSISIFRRLSLFHEKDNWTSHCKRLWSFNLHFQETFFVSQEQEQTLLPVLMTTFNLHFQETFFVSLSQCCYSRSRRLLSISIFRRLSLFQRYTEADRDGQGTSFNLHFQETFFVSRLLSPTQTW